MRTWKTGSILTMLFLLGPAYADINDAEVDQSALESRSSRFCGDIDQSGGSIDISDLVYFAEYLFSDGPPPEVMEDADIDECEGIGINDFIYLIEFMFNSGPPPCGGPPCDPVPGGQIALDYVAGELTPGVLPTGSEITFFLRWTNDQPDNMSGMSNGFRVYSPTGAQWTNTGDTLTGALGIDQFDLYFGTNSFGIDGMGADTIALNASVLYQPGLIPGFDDVVLGITIGPIDPAYDGGTICLDSSWFRPEGEWQWSASGAHPRIPAWDGPHCFLISDEAPACGDANCDGITSVPDVARGISYLWGGQWPLDCPGIADADDHEVYTVNDLAHVVRFLYGGGPDPVCPPTQPPLSQARSAAVDSIFLHTYESAFPSQEYFPAQDSTYTIHVHFTTDVTLDCVSLPFHLRVGNEIPIIDSITVPPSGFSTQYYNYTIYQDSGIVALSGFSVTPDYYLTPGTYEVGKIHLSMAAQDSVWRPIEVAWDSMPPVQFGHYVHTPYVVTPDDDVWLPSIYRLFCLQPIRGDMDYNGGETIDISDLVHVADYMFATGPPPRCFEEADLILDQFLRLDIGDLVYLIDYMFNDGPAPPPCPEER